MFKLIKYELRANFLKIIGICAIVIIANLFLMTKKGSWEIAVPVLSSILIFVAITVIFTSSLSIMSKYLYEDSGYLLFTLPQSGVSILSSRIITALIQISIVAGVSSLMLYLNVTEQLSSILSNMLKNINPGLIVYNIFNYICFVIYGLTMIYFCMVMGKVGLKGKKLGKIGSFIIFVILTIALGWLSTKITTLLPQNFDLSKLSINTNEVIINSDFTVSGGEYNINIAQSILDIIIFVGLFMSTSYLIDKKLDLS